MRNCPDITILDNLFGEGVLGGQGYLSVPEGYLSVPEGYLYKG